MINLDRHEVNESIEADVRAGRLTRPEADRLEYHDFTQHTEHVDGCPVCGRISTALARYQQSERWAA